MLTISNSSSFFVNHQLVFNREHLNKRSGYFFITIKLNKKYSQRVENLCCIVYVRHFCQGGHLL